MLASLPLEQTGLGFRITRADLAKLLGCSRAYVTELVDKGVVPIERNGRIDPDRAVRELLRRQPNGGRLRFLVSIRHEIDEAHARAQQAQEAATQATTSLAELRKLITPLTRALLESERRLDLLLEELDPVLGESYDDEISNSLDSAFTRAASTSNAGLFEHLVESDEALAALVAAVRPDLAPPPPPALCEAITEALEGEPLPLLADLDEPPTEATSDPAALETLP
ncbi:hypothetical protein HW932_09645 [Allochromatium humboldtianum]|uniref:Uncharacterized protein n=1 Tax=Allochromatium humboldtianum TaxID=504901 RepID=A0A850RB21_9GAMM|nr:hypothetical protein [Allochromatium humboldtianum]NVZ09526.1 hypothetical protein [Allochromatium humboldtianum]